VYCGFCLGAEAKDSTASFSKAVDFLINLIPLVCFKTASVQILFVSEYRGLYLFLQTEEQSYLEGLLSPCLNCKNNSREKQRFLIALDGHLTGRRNSRRKIWGLVLKDVF